MTVPQEHLQALQHKLEPLHGLQGRFGDLTWAVAHTLVDDAIAVSDSQIVAAMRLCFERMKVCSPRQLRLASTMSGAGPPFLRLLRALGRHQHWQICSSSSHLGHEQLQHAAVAATMSTHIRACGGTNGLGLMFALHWPRFTGHSRIAVAQMVVEPSGAVGLAAALTPEFQDLAKQRNLRRIGVVLSGGNVDLAEAGLWRKLGGEE